MNRLAFACLASISLAPLYSQALPLNDEFAVLIDLAATSDYRNRGISQTLGDPALQAGATLAHASGPYLGVWTSNVDYGFDFKTRQELDYYAGYYWQATDAISLDLGYIKYSYPQEGQFNQGELYALLDAHGVLLGLYYSNDAPNFFGKDQDTLYSYLGYRTRLPAEVDLELRYGRNDIKDPAFWSHSGASREAYREWQIKLSRELAGVTWGLSYVDTDLSRSECTSWYGYDDLCGATLVASVSKSF
ncbi:hypothetical protein I0D00_04925 [Pseudomonas lalucatii]|uniref:Lipoprotein n=1 Tax=Pseudomonas lalucatii TaxID=1424203 RepID=A0ABS5PXQ9_9PSED|nr:TorF family putative porin [Pseudomonas lalucatii]MBS7661290.1 hypothetical protein [Pseudomonas lalucatii]MBS7691714.1 hypothetical protein [Pseudomonas lalucatii]MBS7724176.1 hypothetical protein [Pseudomonas lalucatii]QVM87820.1 hypothetical protein I0D68_01920 [Pseudomonas lalucatii]